MWAFPKLWEFKLLNPADHPVYLWQIFFLKAGRNWYWSWKLNSDLSGIWEISITSPQMWFNPASVWTWFGFFYFSIQNRLRSQRHHNCRTRDLTNIFAKSCILTQMWQGWSRVGQQTATSALFCRSGSSFHPHPNPRKEMEWRKLSVRRAIRVHLNHIINRIFDSFIHLLSPTSYG